MEVKNVFQCLIRRQFQRRVGDWSGVVVEGVVGDEVVGVIGYNEVFVVKQ